MTKCNHKLPKPRPDGTIDGSLKMLGVSQLSQEMINAIRKKKQRRYK